MKRRRRDDILDAARWIFRNRERLGDEFDASAIAAVSRWELARYGGLVELREPEIKRVPGGTLVTYMRRIRPEAPAGLDVDLLPRALSGSAQRIAATLRALRNTGALVRTKRRPATYKLPPRPVFAPAAAEEARRD